MVALQAIVALWVAGVCASAQRQYYNIHQMPVTSFDCRDKILGGYYADPEVNCQMFHICVKIPGQGVQDFRFLCPNETVFDQEQQTCADSGDIDCAASGLFLENFDLYRLGTAQAAKSRPVIGGKVSKVTAIPLGPSTQSPILTNNVQDDDDFYLQRSDTGDRRLHSKDLLRGSSSSNLFNNRNRGKDLDDDDDDDTPRNVNEAPQSYRPKSSQQSRGKSQYNTQFRSAAPSTTTTTTTTTTTVAPPTRRPQEEKKRTKIAVRKLARKRPSTPEEVRSTTATFTTQVAQKLSFGDSLEDRYSTINRSPSPSPQQPTRQYQQNFRSKTEATTAAVPINNNLSRSSTASFQPNYQQQSAQTTPAFQPNYNQQSVPSSTPFPQNIRQNNDQHTTAFHRQNEASTPAFFEPSPTANSRGAFNGRPIVAGSNFQQPNRQTPAPESFQSRSTPVPQNQQQNFNRPQSNNNQFNNFNRQPAQNNQNFNRQPVQNTQNFNRPSNQQVTNQPQNFNRANNQQVTNQPQNFNRVNNQQVTNQPQNFNQNVNKPAAPQQNFNQNVNKPAAPQQNFNQNVNRNPPQNPPQNFNRQTNQFTNAPTTRVTASPTIQTRPPVNLPVVRAQTINAALQPRPTPSNRQVTVDDFEDNDKQEFLKTAPSSNFRPSDINSFSNTYKSENAKTEVTKQVSTTKYYTPTIVTTPKSVSSTAAPRPAAPSSSSDKDKDNSYDYAYYDDAGAFSEYDALDVLGEQDFSRTSHRTKSRLI